VAIEYIMNNQPRYICIHGHFYQPPRENPWLEEIEAQESAHPYHDWNERITEECYKPNAHARILDHEGRLGDIINNYEHISFNFGPTLLSWLEKHAAETYRAILQADVLSRKQRSGHGNALAQAYNHIIMPLASSRDKLTQIVWGIEDFRHRFRREPEGMWLPETAVDSETLEIMVEHGIRFTILSPVQAKRFRFSSHDTWVDLAPGAIDPSRPYLCRLSRGRSIVLFFYDSPISHAIAFESLLISGDNLKNRLLGAFSDARTWPQLVHIATDGESYGHHHRFGEMALAYALRQLLLRKDVRLTNYGEFLDKHPPSAEAEFIENSSWSCAHGVGRWSWDCGCSVSQRRDWNQKWRAPLRRSLDILRDRADKLFTEKASSLLKDPWDARNAYIRVVLENRPKIGPFFKVYGRKLNKGQRELALKLLEMQRNRMLMYTSCGWFFDDISGIEALQILRYAARVIQIAYPFDPTVVDVFLKELAEARSNVKPNLLGDRIFDEKIRPQVTGLANVAAHVAISSVFEEIPAKARLYCYDVKLLDSVREESADRTLVVGRISVLSRITTMSREFAFVVIHLGGVDLRCSVEEFPDQTKYEAVRQDLLDTLSSSSSTELFRTLDRHFPGDYFRLRDLFVEQRRKIIQSLTTKMYEMQGKMLEDFYEKNRDLAKLILMHETVVPDTFLASARFVINRSLTEELEKLSAGVFPDLLQSVVEESQLWNLKLDTSSAERLIADRITSLVRSLAKRPHDREVPAEINRFLDLGRDMELSIDLREAQILFFRMATSFQSRGEKKLPEAFVQLAERLAVNMSHR
jgi:alpha-amylase/alpha-mannosidase (GH57 family)